MIFSRLLYNFVCSVAVLRSVLSVHFISFWTISWVKFIFVDSLYRHYPNIHKIQNTCMYTTIAHNNSYARWWYRFIFYRYMYMLKHIKCEFSNVYGTMFPFMNRRHIEIMCSFQIDTFGWSERGEKKTNSEETKTQSISVKRNGLCGRSDRLKISTYWKTSDWKTKRWEHNVEYSAKHFILRAQLINLDDFSQCAEKMSRNETELYHSTRLCR